MAQLIYRTGNASQAQHLTRQLLGMMLALCAGPMIAVSVIVLAQHPGRAELFCLGAILSLIAALVFLPAWFYGRGFCNLTFTIAEDGLRVRFLETLMIPWGQVLALEKVRPTQVLINRLCGMAYGDFAHGLFSSDRGRAWVWWAGEKEGVFMRTERRNYLFAPERIDEFMQTVQSKTRR